MAGQHQPDLLGLGAERVRLRGVEVQRAQILIFDEQLQRQHRPHPVLNGGGGEPRPPPVCGQVVRADRRLLLHRGQARPLAGGVLQLVDPFHQFIRCRRRAHLFPALGNHGETGVSAALGALQAGDMGHLLVAQLACLLWVRAQITGEWWRLAVTPVFLFAVLVISYPAYER